MESTADRSVPRSIEFKSLWRRKGLLIAPLLIALGLGGAYLAQAPSVYEAEARILLEPGEAISGTALARDRRTDERFLMATQAEVLRSPVLVRRALEQTPPPTTLREGVNLERLALAGLEVAPLGDARVLRLRFRGPDAEWTNGFLEALIRTYAADLRDAQHRRYVETSRWLAGREALLQDQLSAARQEYADARRESPLVGQGPDAGRLQLDTLRRLEQQLNAMRHRRLDVESRVQAAAQRDEADLAAISAAPRVVPAAFQLDGQPPVESADAIAQQPDADAQRSVTALKPQADLLPGRTPESVGNDVAMTDPARVQQELSQARARAEQLAQQYGPKHPELRAARAAVEFWESRLTAALAESTATSLREIEALRISERWLQSQYDDAVAAAHSTDARLLEEQQQLDRIRRLDELQLSTHASLVEAQAAAQALAGGSESAVLRVLEAPGEKVSTVWPRPLPVLAACGVLSLFGGLVLIGLTTERRV